MKRVLERIIAAIFMIGAASACTPAPKNKIMTKNPQVVAPMNNKQGEYQLGVYTLEGISDLQTLSGKYARFYFAPRMVDGKLVGDSPKTRFIKNEKGEFAPANETTQQLVTIYAHLQNLAKLDEELGAGGVNNWPRDVGVGVRVSGGLKNNAFYDGASDSMLFVPYDKAGLPISVNGGILAHEHFHSLFFKLAIREKNIRASIHDEDIQFENQNAETLERPSESGGVKAEEISPANLRSFYNIVLLRGINEGLADYWGWMYSGDTEFITQSLPKEGMGRSLKEDQNFNNALPTQKTIENALSVLYSTGNEKNMKDYSVGYAYTIGTKISKILKAFSETYSRVRGVENQQSRKDVAKVIIKTLPLLREDFANKTEGLAYTSLDYLKTFISQFGDLKAEECAYFIEILNKSEKTVDKVYACTENNSSWKLDLQPRLPPASQNLKQSNQGQVRWE